MKVKKIITAASCAALIAAAALPLTACGGAKSLQKTDLNIKDYAVAYEPTGTKFSYPGDVQSQTLESDLYSISTSYQYFVRTTKIDDGNGSATYSFYNKATGAKVVQFVEAADVSYNRFVVTTRSASEDNLGFGPDIYTIYSEDGKMLVNDAYDYYTIDEEEYYVGNDNKKSKFVRIDYRVENGDTKQDYFKYETDSQGNRTYSSTKTDKSELKSYTSEYEVGSNAFAAGIKLENINGEKETGLAAQFSYKLVGNEMVFSKADEETGRVCYDNITDFVVLGDTILYTKLVELPEGDKSANVIKSLNYGDAYYSYEIHSYSLETNKDKKLDNYGIMIDSMQPMYNYTKKSYDAVAIRGCKLDGKTYQYRSSFQYIVTADLKIGFDVTGLAGFTNGSAKIVEMSNGNYAVQTSIGVTPVNNKLEPTGNLTASGATIKYYENENLYRIRSNETGAYGFVDANGKVVIEPIYGTTSYPVDGVTFYGGKALTTNNVTGERVILSADGSEKVAPQSSHSDYLNYTDVTYEDGWYTVKTTSFDEDTYEMTVKLELYNLSGKLLTSVTDSSDIDFSAVSGSSKLYRVRKSDGTSLLFIE